MLGQGACHWHTDSGEKLGAMLPLQTAGMALRQRGTRHRPRALSVTVFLSRGRGMTMTSWRLQRGVGMSETCKKKTNQTPDKRERPQTPAILAKWPEQGLCRNGPLHSAHTSSVVPAPTHQPFSTLGEKVSRATRSPAAGPVHFRLPGTGRQQEGQTGTALGLGEPQQAAAHAPRGHPSEERCLLLSDKCHTLTQ